MTGNQRPLDLGVDAEIDAPLPDVGAIVAEAEQRVADARRSVAERVAIDLLEPHPRNYKAHPEDQLQHIIASLRDHGFYRNVVTARDYTILAGHGVVEAARRIGLTTVPVVRMDLDAMDPRALKLLAGDNEIGRLGMVDDRALSDLVKELGGSVGLLGTGYDAAQLAALVMTTRPEGEIATRQIAAEWVGLPEANNIAERQPTCVVLFASEDDRARFMALLGDVTIRRKDGPTWTFYWPKQAREPLSKALRFDDRQERLL